MFRGFSNTRDIIMKYYLRVTNKRTAVSLYRRITKSKNRLVKTWIGKVNVKEYEKIVSGDNLVLTGNTRGIY